jgi:hypothetical protein
MVAPNEGSCEVKRNVKKILYQNKSIKINATEEDVFWTISNSEVS